MAGSDAAQGLDRSVRPQSSVRELPEHIERTDPVVGVRSMDRQENYYEAKAPGMAVIAVSEDDTELAEFDSQPLAKSGPTNATALDRAAVMFTSGTTAAPKGVVITQANYAFAGDVMAAAVQLTQLDRQFVVLPLFHANAQYYSFASAISVGASVALMHRFSASRFVDHAVRHSVTHASLFAAPIRMILARDGGYADRAHSIHAWFAQNVSSDQYRDIAQLLGCQPRLLYGMTETIPAVLTNRPLTPVAESIGTPTVGCRVALVEPGSLERVGPGQVGEIVVGGTRGVSLFQGYLDDPKTTQDSFTEGWFRTGDLARIDEAGRYYFVGRRDDVIKVAGENVSVVEIESVLSEHQDVLKAAVVSESDAVRDQVPVASVVARGKPPTLKSLQSHFESHLAPAKRPQKVYLVDELPRTSVGKIRKFRLDPSLRGARRIR